MGVWGSPTLTLVVINCISKYDPSGFQYTGLINYVTETNFTTNGAKCKNWNDTYHRHHFGDHNFCRNSEDMIETGPGCFVAQPSDDYGWFMRCDVMACSEEKENEIRLAYGKSGEVIWPGQIPDPEVDLSIWSGKKNGHYNPSVGRRDDDDAFKVQQCNSKFCWCLLEWPQNGTESIESTIPRIDYKSITKMSDIDAQHGTSKNMECDFQIDEFRFAEKQCYMEREEYIKKGVVYDRDIGVVSEENRRRKWVATKDLKECDYKGLYKEHQEYDNGDAECVDVYKGTKRFLPDGAEGLLAWNGECYNRRDVRVISKFSTFATACIRVQFLNGTNENCDADGNFPVGHPLAPKKPEYEPEYEPDYMEPEYEQE